MKTKINAEFLEKMKHSFVQQLAKIDRLLQYLIYGIHSDTCFCNAISM